LVTRSGIPAETIRQEQAARLTERISQKSGAQQTGGTAKPLPAAIAWDGNGSHPTTEQEPITQENGAYPHPHTEGETQSRPTLDEQQEAFLAFLAVNPDMPIAAVAKGLKMRAVTATAIRDTLKAQGLLQELVVRTGTTGAGRPMKLLIPTFRALERLGSDLPAGRGGVLHRHIQHLVQEGARAKGYSVQVEYDLDSGAIVDVHLEKGAMKIAVEIAVVSTPERELNHIKRCLAAGYNQVYSLFADVGLLARLATTVQETFSQEDLGKVRLLPLSRLSHVG
jgi:hypothetical protein